MKSKSEYNPKHESQSVQFFGGLAAAVKYVVTGSPLVAPPLDNKFDAPNRQHFHDELEKVSQKEVVKQSKHAQYEIGMMKGQNYAQNGLSQSMPKESIPAFIKQVEKHAELDEKARSKGQPHASPYKHAKANVVAHQELKKIFKETGYTSGFFLHSTAEFQNTLIRDASDPNRTVFDHASFK